MAEYIERTEIERFIAEHGRVGPFSVDLLPSADVAPVRHGRWGVEVGMNFFKERNCPVCKKRIESNFWSFCPNCGSKMDGGEP